MGWPKITDVIDEHAEEADIQYYCETTQTSIGLYVDGNKIHRAIAEQLFPEWCGKAYK